MKPAAAALALVLLPACGDGDGDGDEGPVAYDVVLVVGAAEAIPAADTAGFPGIGSDFTERWVLDCDGAGCTLHRNPGPPLGLLEELRLEPAGDGSSDDLRGVAAGVTAVPSPVEPSPCEGTPAETWTIEVELTREGDTIVGSVFRVPDALRSGDCFGLDLTLGLSGFAVP